MLQIGGKAVDTLYVGSKLVKQVYVGSRKVYPDEGVIPKQIKDAMVLWYDLKRQGATNESMAENPVLEDLSGNGHDATCYNFAWSGMSGIGGYSYSFLDGEKTTSDLIVNQVNSFSVTITIPEGHNGTYIYRFDKEKYNNSYSYILNVDVSQYPSDGKISLLCNNAITNKKELNPGDNEIIPFEDTIFNDDTKTVYLECNYPCEITFSIKPLYPHALVSDGVDDYAYVEGLPLLTKERGYTVIAKRKWLEKVMPKGNTTIASKLKTVDSINYSAFNFEHFGSDGSLEHWSFNNNNKLDALYPSDITYATKDSYNGIEVLKPGSASDSDHLILFATRIDAKDNAILALYSFLLFNRDLTQDEIDWVKTNLMN